MRLFARQRSGQVPAATPGVSSRCLRGALVGALLLVLTPASDAGQSAPAARQVLVLQSMDRGNLVHDNVTADFRAAIHKRAGSRVTLFDFVVGPAGLGEAPEEALIEFLRSIYAHRRPELIVTMGGPAAAFARRHRKHLFPETPTVLAALQTRALGPAPLSESESSVSVEVDHTVIMDDLLRLLPDTRNVLMVTGSGPIRAFWEPELKRNFERYRDRLTFIWSWDSSYEQMLQRAATLPPRSAIFYLAGGTFAAGSWQGDERTLADLSARANGPVFGAQTAWLGAGIVGGHLLDTRDLGATTADVVMRILDGESSGRIRIAPLTMGPAVFDARQLRRWNIPDSQLPSGSEVRFRGPSLWRDYRPQVLGVSAAVLVQALLILGLVYQRRARRQAEVASRRHLSLAADANRRMTMSALTGSIAHELSQPLNSILHNAQAGEMMVASNRVTPEALGEILADIRTADVRATEIIERHRTMLRSRRIEPKPVDVHAVVRESVTLVAHDTRERLIDVDVDLPPAPCIVIGDHVLLQQVMVNLMMNAMDAMAETPAGRRLMTVRSDGGTEDRVAVSVRDAGSGLPGPLDGHLFEPFVTTKAHGIGIGLAIARTIVESHRGSIDARNNPEGGATFSVTLPCSARPSVSQADAAS